MRPFQFDLLLLGRPGWWNSRGRSRNLKKGGGGGSGGIFFKKGGGGGNHFGAICIANKQNLGGGGGPDPLDLPLNRVGKKKKKYDFCAAHRRNYRLFQKKI